MPCIALIDTRALLEQWSFIRCMFIAVEPMRVNVIQKHFHSASYLQTPPNQPKQPALQYVMPRIHPQLQTSNEALQAEEKLPHCLQR